jgi:hypothetical protein
MYPDFMGTLFNKGGVVKRGPKNGWNAKLDKLLGGYAQSPAYG